MYFPPNMNQQANGYILQSQIPMYPQQMMYPQVQQVPANPFMYPTKLQPYNDREFLCKTFNFRVPFIEAFLSLSHEEKLKFFLICESRRLTGQLNDKETYSKILEKIMTIVNPNYRKFQSQQQYKPISEEELKKKILEKEFEQKCEWELRKLGMGEESANAKQNTVSNVHNSSNGIGMNMNADEFDFWSPKKTQLQNQQISENKNTNNLNEQNDDDEFVLGDEVQQNQLPSTNYYQNSFNQPSFSVQSTIQTPNQQQPASYFQPQYKPTIPKQLPNQEQEWQQAQEIVLPNTLPTNNIARKSSIIAEQKVESIWDLEINEQEIKKSEPDIKEIFGIKSQQDDFGGFQQANVQTMQNPGNYSSFLKQNQFRYETVAEVNNDWLLGSGNNHPVVITGNNNCYDIDSGIGAELTSGILNYENADMKQNINQQNWTFNEQISQPQTTSSKIPKFDINSFDVNSLLISNSYPSQTQQTTTNNVNLIPDFSSTMLTATTTTSPSMELDINISSFDFTSNLDPQLTNPTIGIENQQQLLQKQQQEDEQWEEGEEIVTIAESQPQRVFFSKQEPQTVISFENAPVNPKEEMIFDYTQLNGAHQQTSNPYEFNFNDQTINNSPNYDPFRTIEQSLPQNIENPVPIVTSNNVTFQFTSEPHSNITNLVQPAQKLELSSPTLSQKEIKPIKKIMKPPSMKNIQIEESNFNHFKNIESNNKGLIVEEPKIKELTSPKSNLSSYIQPTNLANLQSPKVQNNISSVFSKKNNLSAQTALNLSIVPSINIAVTSSTLLPPLTSSLPSSPKIPQHMSASTYITSRHEPKQEKIISTYSKQLSYTPDSFRSSIKSMLTKSKTFFKPFSKQNKQRSSAEIIKEVSQESNLIEQHSMMDVGNGNDREFLTGSHKVSSVYNPKVQEKGFAKNRGLDYSIDAHMANEQKYDEFDNGQSKEDEFNEVEDLNQGDQRTNKLNFAKKSSSSQQDNNHVSQLQQQQDMIISSENELQNSEQHIKLLIGLSRDFMLKLPQNDINYLNNELKKNNFFFNKQFYLRLKQTIQKLSLNQDLKHFFKSISRVSTSPASYIPQQSSNLFSTELTFVSQIIEKLQKIQELNKKFTLAMEQDQQEELAQVVFRSKQLTFEVNEDGQVAKRIVGLVVDVRNKEIDQEEDIDEETEKYKGLYYMIVKLVMKQKPTMNINPLPQQQLTHLKNIYKDASSSSLSSKSHFLFTCIILYLLHSQLNQLQYIKNISQTIFGYLIKQHAILITKINEIKTLSTKYAEPPQAIFARLMESTKMTEYLTGLGEMAGVAERLSEVAKKIGMRFDREEYSNDRLAKTITEARQLAVKYNLLKNSSTQHNSQTIYSPYLAILLSMVSNGKPATQIFSQMRCLLKQRPICKICLSPRGEQPTQEGDFISNAVAVSSQSLGSRDSIEWCHFACYNMLKMAFQDASDGNVGISE